MVAELARPRDYVPAALFRHPAWTAWKEAQGWSRLDLSVPLFSRAAGARWCVSLLRRSLGPGLSMAYAPGSPSLPLLFRIGGGDGGEDAAYGAELEELSLRLLPYLAKDCAFIRWDPPLPAWTDGEGRPLEVRLQELRMNAPTRHRRLRKAPAETICPETIVVDLAGGADAVEARMDGRVRYSARLAERRGTAVESVGEAGLGDFHALHCLTAPRHGLPVHPEYRFRELFRFGGEAGLDLDLYLARSEGKAVAAGVFARHGDEGWYLFAASDPRRREAAGPTALLRRALRDYAEAGVSRMDLLGVGPAGAADHPLAGLSRFKGGFGGVRRSRLGAWDFVIDPDAYEAFTRTERIALS